MQLGLSTRSSSGNSFMNSNYVVYDTMYRYILFEKHAFTVPSLTSPNPWAASREMLFWRCLSIHICISVLHAIHVIPAAIVLVLLVQLALSYPGSLCIQVYLRCLELRKKCPLLINNAHCYSTCVKSM